MNGFLFFNCIIVWIVAVTITALVLSGGIAAGKADKKCSRRNGNRLPKSACGSLRYCYGVKC